MRLLIALALPFLILANAAQAALPACSSAAERQAQQVRALQSYLMMAGVGCNQAGAYNGFVKRYQGALSGQGGQLKSYFTRVYGRSSESKLNNFITELANEWSRVHMSNMKGYCEATWQLMWQLGRTPAADSATLITTAQTILTSQSSINALLCSTSAASARR